MGTVVEAGWGGAYGNQIVIKMNDGTYTQYGHLSSIGVSVGQKVTPGRQIGLSGATGNVTVTATLLDETPHDFTGTTAKNSFTISGVDVEAVDADSAALTATVDVSVTDDIPTLVINDPDVGTPDDQTTVSEGGGVVRSRRLPVRSRVPSA